jgi:hypothetical protein
MKLNKAAIDSYGRHLLGAVVSAIAAIGALTGQSPVDFSSGDWWAVANSVWVATVPVALRYFNTKDPAFGKVAEAVAKEVGKKINSKSRPSKKAVKK